MAVKVLRFGMHVWVFLTLQVSWNERTSLSAPLSVQGWLS